MRLVEKIILMVVIVVSFAIMCLIVNEMVVFLEDLTLRHLLGFGVYR